MRLFITSVLIILCIVVVLLAQPLVRIGYDDFVQVANSANFDVAYVRPGAYVEIVGWQNDMNLLVSIGVPYQITISDLPQYYASRMSSSLPMGDYRTYEEILLALDSLADLYPDIVSPRDSIAVGWDGNVMWSVKISDNVATDEDEPEVLYDAAIHAREVIVPEVLLYYMRWLCENYGSDPLATYLVDQREMWFITNVNPDGYMINEIYNPEGGGMWRKNTRDNNENGIFDPDYDGVDMNRNFGFHWGEVGASTDPSYGTYMGPDSMSEPELHGYRNFVMSRNFTSNITYHSYSGLYLFPWGYTADHCTDHDYFMLITDWMAERNNYPHGNIYDAIYPASGTTVDWMYGTQGIYSITPEVGGWLDGFWPPQERIIPLCESQLLANIIISIMAGAAPRVVDATFEESSGDGDGYTDVGEQVVISASLRNYGVLVAEGVSVSASAISDGITMIDSITPPSATIAEKGGSASLSGITFSIGSPIVPGQTAEVTLSATMDDGYVWVDTFSFTVGTPEVLGETSFDSGYSGWSFSGDWVVGTPTERPTPRSAPSVLATRLTPDYSDSALSVATSPTYFISDDVFNPRLSFWTWYNIEGSEGEYYDGGNVQVRVLPDTSWSVMEPSDGYPAVLLMTNPFLPGQPGFSGSSSGWEKISFDLTPFAGDSIQFRLVFGTDRYVSYEGWFIDDWEVVSFQPETTSLISLEAQKFALRKSFAVPNPFNSSCQISIPGARKIILRDISGRAIAQMDAESGVVIWDGRDASGRRCHSGIYFATPDAELAYPIKLLLIR